MIAAGIGALSCLIWVVLIAGWGRFWRISTTTDGLTLHPGLAPRVAVVVPARDEADVIGQAVRSLLEQVYPGPLHIFVVDDHSTDDTSGAVAAAVQGRNDRVTLLSAAPLPAGWTGKMWALAQAHALDMVSMMVKLECSSVAERALIPAFVFFFFMLYPPAWVNDRRKRT